VAGGPKDRAVTTSTSARHSTDRPVSSARCQFGNHPSFPFHCEDGLGQQRHPTFKRIKQNDSKVGASFSNHQARDAPTRTQIHQKGAFGNLADGGNESFGVGNVVENRTRTEDAKAPSSLEDLKQWGRRLHLAIVAPVPRRFGQQPSKNSPCPKTTMAPHEAGPLEQMEVIIRKE